MSQIPKPQGNIKLSEVGVDTAQELILTAANEDTLTAMEQLRRVLSDALRKTNYILLSNGAITWTGSTGKILVPTGVSITFKILLNPASSTARTVNLVYTGVSNAVIGAGAADVNGTSIYLSDGAVLYIELDRAQANLGATLALDASTPGKRLVISTQAGMPVLESNPAAAFQSTIAVPLAIRQNGGGSNNLWWIPHGILWQESISSFLGQISTSSTIPLGGIIALHRPDGSTNSGVTQAFVNSVAPGFWLCNGSLINNASSPFNGFYSPNMNGNAAPASGLPASDRTPLFPRGNAQSQNTGAAYGGTNSKSLTLGQMPAHAHSGTTSSNGNHRHQLPNEDGGGPEAGIDGGGDFVTGDDRFTDFAGSHTHTITTNSQGSGSAIDFQPRYFDVVYIIRVI